jgi:CheY-like chemotaxis protein
VQASAAIQHKFGGTGLGLSISRKIIDLMGGHIEVNSSPGSGTTFSIQLKLRTGAEAASSEDTIIDTAFLKNKKILVADDSEENRSVMIDILHTFHPEIITDEAENGIEILEKAKHTIYDYILMDLDMPGKNGLETLPELKQLTTTTNTKVIAHTASLLMLSADDFIEIGFDDLLQKPFPPRELLFKLYQLR